jgi:T4-like virus tail tube protein gp19
MFNVDNFRTAMQFDGARPNLFEVVLQFPSFVQLGSQATSQSRFFVKTAQLPGSTIGAVTVPYFGREVKVAGNRTFQDWTVTVINDEDFTIRNAFERWHRGINGNQTNLREPGAVSTSPLAPGTSYAVDAEVYQYSKAGGKPLKKYRFVGMFPNDLAAIDLDWSSNDTIEEFTVTLSYQYWLSDDTKSAVPQASA